MRKPTTRKAMVEYLAGHFRYDTMNSWNQSTSYAVKIKAHYLGLSRDKEQAVYEMLECPDSWEDSGFSEIIHEFDVRHGYCWQIGSNGRSGGYLVLYQGGAKPSEHKSICTACGQRNFTAIEENSTRCGRCGRNTRINRSFPAEPFSYPGKSLDMEEDFSEWCMDDLRNRVDLVWEFDRTCAAAVKAYVDYATKHQAEEKTVMVPKKVVVARPRKSA